MKILEQKLLVGKPTGAYMTLNSAKNIIKITQHKLADVSIFHKNFARLKIWHMQETHRTK